MPPVTFHGGPCIGTTRNYTTAALVDGKATCQGTVYDVFPNGRGGYFGVPEALVQTTTTVPPLSAAAKGWKNLVHGVAKTAPDYLTEAARYRRAMLRLGGR